MELGKEEFFPKKHELRMQLDVSSTRTDALREQTSLRFRSGDERVRSVETAGPMLHNLKDTFEEVRLVPLQDLFLRGCNGSCRLYHNRRCS